MTLAVAHRKTFDLACFEIPWVCALSDDAAVLAVDLEPFVPFHAHGESEIEVAVRAICELHRDEPTTSAKLLLVFRPDGEDLAAKKTRGIHQMAAMPKEVVREFIRFGVSGRTRRLRA
ncbi:MAG TPA: hypothetical protein VIS96_05075 [Terrimicrobiaceae bacterium]